MAHAYNFVMTQEALLNRLGAVSLTLVDQILASLPQAGGLGITASSALVAAAHQSTPPTIGELAQICGVSHSVMVRVIEQLDRNGLVNRSAGLDRRSVQITVSDAGRSSRDRILANRMAALAPVVAGLTENDKEALLRILTVMLETLTTSRLESEHICRLCDNQVCGEDCPTEAKAQCIEQTISRGQNTADP